MNPIRVTLLGASLLACLSCTGQKDAETPPVAAADASAELKDWPVDPVELATQMAEANTSAITSTQSVKKGGNTPTPAGGDGKKPTPDKRQGQVTKESK